MLHQWQSQWINRPGHHRACMKGDLVGPRQETNETDAQSLCLEGRSLPNQLGSFLRARLRPWESSGKGYGFDLIKPWLAQEPPTRRRHTRLTQTKPSTRALCARQPLDSFGCDWRLKAASSFARTETPRRRSPHEPIPPGKCAELQHGGSASGQRLRGRSTKP